MWKPPRLLALAAATLPLLCGAPLARADHADPSGRVAHLSQSDGDVSYSPAGEDEWLDAARNRPLIQGDRLWTDRDARAELQVGNAALRLDADTSLEILNLDDRIAQVRLTQGTLNLRVPRLYPGQSYEVATPTLAFTVTRPGRYRIDVDGQDDQTTIVVWQGGGEAYGDRAHFPLRAGDTVRFYGADLRDHEIFDLPRADAFDRYCLERDRRLDRSPSRRYVDDDVVGYADLDDYGGWRPVSGYGPVWFPSHVDADWAPYRDGHWVWQEPWGWTWVDDAPWGFAPSHYGRWVHASGSWGWIPGPRNVRPVYAPALVAFIGGNGWSVSLSAGQSSPIGWFPLAPREVYVPSYPASRQYFTRVNVNNTVVNNTTITNIYNNNYGNGNTNVTQVNYANRAVAGAVTAVPSTVFVNAQPVRPAAIRIESKAAANGDISRSAPVAPSVRSVLGPGAPARSRPSREAQDRAVVARSAPPPAERPFAAREQRLQQQPGQPPEPVAAQAAPGGDTKPAPAPNVRVIADAPGAVDARAAGPGRGEGRRAARAGEPAARKPLERPAEARAKAGPAPVESKPAEATAPAAPAAPAEQEAVTKQQEQRRRAESDQQSARQNQLEQQRKAESDQQAAKQDQADRQRKAENDQQAAKQKDQAERQRKAESDQQGAKQDQADRQRKAENDQQAAKQKDQAEQQRKAESAPQPAAKPDQAEQQRLAEAQRLEKRRLDCERDARRQHKDPGPCRADTPPKKESRNDDKGGKKDKGAE